MNEFKIIRWARLEHCPDQQLVKPGSPTDAGYDIVSAEDKLILPYSKLDFELIPLVRESDGSTVMFDELSLEIQQTIPEAYVMLDGTILRPKYKNVLVKTGVKVHPQDLMYTMIASRSSCIKWGMGLANSVGIVDFSYSGELMVGLYSLNTELPTIIIRGERIAQLIPRPQIRSQFLEVSDEEYEAHVNNRGARGGFGSTDTFTYQI